MNPPVDDVHEVFWAERELPGFVLLATYFVGGSIFAVLMSRASGGTIPRWRWFVLVLIIQIAALVPMKMFLRWLFNIKYVIYLPEFGLNV
jgi:hypothetical protein